MFGRSWKIFRLFGIPISIHWSWLIIVVLITVSLQLLFRQQVQDLPAYVYWLMGLGTALAFFLCILLHEMGHALVARKEGIPMRGITLFLFGGVAQMEAEPPSALKEFFMAIAGPVVSLVLGGIFAILWGLGMVQGWHPAAVAVFGELAFINILVLVFNMVPAFPLDGGRVLRSILWGITNNLKKATQWASMGGQVFAWFLIGLGVFAFISDPRDFFVVGFWFVLIGFFLLNAAKMGYQQVLIRQALEGEPIRRFMNPHPISVSPHVTLRDWVEDYVYHYHHKGYPVMDNGHVDGFITTRALGDFSRSEWDRHTVAEAMEADISDLAISPHADALDAFERMQRTGSSRLLVIEGEQLLGIISLKDLLQFLQLKLELEGGEDEEPPRRMPPYSSPEQREHVSH